jgi:hypothetical protein
MAMTRRWGSGGRAPWHRARLCTALGRVPRDRGRARRSSVTRGCSSRRARRRTDGACRPRTGRETWRAFARPEITGEGAVKPQGEEAGGGGAARGGAGRGAGSARGKGGGAPGGDGPPRPQYPGRAGGAVPTSKAGGCARAGGGGGAGEGAAPAAAATRRRHGGRGRARQQPPLASARPQLNLAATVGGSAGPGGGDELGAGCGECAAGVVGAGA